jgi:hypothetical protein
MPADARNPLLVSADAWASEHTALLAACFDRFTGKSAWPPVEQLQHDMELADQPLEASEEIWRMPRELGFVEEQRLVLRVRALGHLPAASALLDDWYAVVRLAYARWLADPESHLTKADVLELLDGDRARARAVSVLLLRESWPFGSGHGGPDDEWSRELHAGVRAARAAGSARELIDIRDAIELPPRGSPERSPATQAPGERKGLVAKAWTLASENQLIAGLIVAIIVAGAGAAIRVATRDGGSGAVSRTTGASSPQPGQQTTPSPTPGQQREQAGSGGARTYSRPKSLSGESDAIEPGQFVLVSCKLYSPMPPSVKPDGYWYRLSSPPWNGKAYAPANSFWNGDVPGHKPYTHNTDRSVPDC